MPPQCEVEVRAFKPLARVYEMVVSFVVLQPDARILLHGTAHPTHRINQHAMHLCAERGKLEV